MFDSVGRYTGSWQVEVDVQMVRRVFEDVLSGRMSRDQADRWAYSVIQQEEAGTLVYSPPADEKRIWDGVMYLYGVDIRVGPGGEYLHSDEDIEIAMQQKLGEA